MKNVTTQASIIEVPGELSISKAQALARFVESFFKCEENQRAFEKHLAEKCRGDTA